MAPLSLTVHLQAMIQQVRTYLRPTSPSFRGTVKAVRSWVLNSMLNRVVGSKNMQGFYSQIFIADYQAGNFLSIYTTHVGCISSSAV